VFCFVLIISRSLSLSALVESFSILSGAVEFKFFFSKFSNVIFFFSTNKVFFALNFQITDFSKIKVQFKNWTR
jgi:hypothetical protein